MSTTGAAQDTVDHVRVHRVVPRTVAEGPGIRAAVWVQGCSIRCPGCFNRETWTRAGGIQTRAGGIQMPWRDLAEQLLSDPDTEGITLLGGEPFDQADVLARVAAHVQSARRSVMTFTGYTIEDLRASRRPDVLALLAATDLLADGPFIASQPELHRPWVGSANQRLIDLSGRYADLAERIQATPNRLEIRIAPDGRTDVNGFATRSQLARLLAGLGRRP